MLCVTRKTDEQIIIGDDVIITVCRVRGTIVKIGVEAPISKKIMRAEIADVDVAAVRRRIDSLNSPGLGEDHG